MARPGTFRKAACALALALVGALAPASAALGADWTSHPLPGEGAEAQLFGISCPTTSLCVAVGGNNTIASSTNPTAPGGWNAVYAGEGVVPGSPNQRQIKGVSCPSPQLCVAVNFEGKVYASTNPSGDASAWSVADLSPTGPSIHFYGVSCPTTAFCAAVGGDGVIAVSTNPAGGAAAWTVTRLPQPLELRGISCNSPSFCVAVGDSGTGIRPEASNLGEIVTSTAPLAGAWQQAELPGSHGSLYAVSCPSTALCVSGDMFGNLLAATNPLGGAPAWSSFPGGATVQVTGASCFSAASCVLVDNNGDALSSTDPAAGAGAWAVQNLIPYSVDPLIRNAIWSVSCPSPTFCAIGGTGQVLTSLNPTAPPPAPEKSAGKGKNGGRKHRRPRPKRPKVFLATPPNPAQAVRHGKLLLRFRFHAKRGVQVRGFVCSINGGKMRRCHSPRDYRVGPGRYVFRVRAVGWTGLRGPAERWGVRVCRKLSAVRHCPKLKSAG